VVVLAAVVEAFHEETEKEIDASLPVFICFVDCFEALLDAVTLVFLWVLPYVHVTYLARSLSCAA
jgi:hypothetical protein